MQVCGNESGPGSLDLVWTRFEGLTTESLADDRRILWFDGDGLERGLLWVNDFVAACNRTSGTDCGYQNVYFALGIIPKFRCGSLTMNLWIRGILKLLRDPGVWRFSR